MPAADGRTHGSWASIFDKCEVMHIIRGAARSTHVYSMTNHTTDETETLQVTHLERDLGVLVLDDLKLTAQCRAAGAKANLKFRVFKKAVSQRAPSSLCRRRIPCS